VVHTNPIQPATHDRQWGFLCGITLCKPTGVVLVLEDMEIPHGEKAHRCGFLLLDGPHLHKLLRHSGPDSQISTVNARNGRLLAHAIPEACLGKVDLASTHDALKMLKTTARRRIAELRKLEPDSQVGRLHALWTQLLANAELALTPG
jgi:hypothetical protein